MLTFTSDINDVVHEGKWEMRWPDERVLLQQVLLLLLWWQNCAQDGFGSSWRSNKKREGC